MAVGITNKTEKKSFVLYIDTKELWESLSNEQAGKLIKHIYNYAVGDNSDSPDEMTRLLSIQIKKALDRDQDKWEVVKEARSKSGKKGGRPPKAKKAISFNENQNKAKKAIGFVEKQKEANKPVSVNNNAIVNKNGIVEEKLYDVDTLLKKYLADEDLVEAAKQKMGFSGRSSLEKRLTEFNMGLKAKAQIEKTWNDYLSHFMYWDSKFKKSNHSNAPTFNSPVI